jgi:ComF family protein
MLAPVLNLLFPPQCLVCHALVPTHGTLCLGCWQHIQFITDPYCSCCGHPFDFALGKDALCGRCLSGQPGYARARAVFRYDDFSRPLVTRLKYSDQMQLAPVYGTWLYNAGRELVDSSELIVPVPLHYWRFVGRRYNQSALLAYALHKQCGLPVLPDALKRVRATKPQPGLTHKQRQDNVRGAFGIHRRHAQAVRGKAVLLIDDVQTTSATIGECTRTLLEAGALRVQALTLARKI